MSAAALLATALTAGAVATCTTPLAAQLARRLGVLDRPRGYRRHAEATPLLGGLGVAAGALVGALAFRADEAAGPLLVALGAGTGIVGLCGLVDDTRGLSPRHKLAWQIAAAAAAGAVLIGSGEGLELFLDTIPGLRVPLLLLTALWVVWITNAQNLLDNANGLCAGSAALAAASLCVANVASGEAGVATANAALAGACLGFLPHNWPRARVFLGDTGSLAIGFALAALAVLGVYTRGAEAPGVAVLTPLVALALPLVDSVSVVVLRLRAGRPPWLGDRRHLSHRLARRGLGERGAVLVLWATAALCGALAASLRVLPTGLALALIALLGAALVTLALTAGPSEERAPS